MWGKNLCLLPLVAFCRATFCCNWTSLSTSFIHYNIHPFTYLYLMKVFCSCCCLCHKCSHSCSFTDIWRYVINSFFSSWLDYKLYEIGMASLWLTNFEFSMLRPIFNPNLKYIFKNNERMSKSFRFHVLFLLVMRKCFLIQSQKFSPETSDPDFSRDRSCGC